MGLAGTAIVFSTEVRATLATHEAKIAANKEQIERPDTHNVCHQTTKTGD